MKKQRMMTENAGDANNKQQNVNSNRHSERIRRPPNRLGAEIQNDDDLFEDADRNSAATPESVCSSQSQSEDSEDTSSLSTGELLI